MISLRFPDQTRNRLRAHGIVRLSAFLVSIAVAAICRPAQAAQPLVTDDIFTQDTGNHQLEWGMARAHLSDETERTTEATYTYGVSPRLDAFIGMPVRLSSPDGIGDASLGLKWRFVESPDSGMALRGELLLPTGKEERGLGNGSAGAALTWIGSLIRAWGSLHVNAGVGHYRYRLQVDQNANRNFSWRVSSAALWRIREQWQLVADTGIERNIERGSHTLPAFLLTGFIYSPNQDLDLDAGLRVALNCRECAAQTRRQLMAGLTWRF